MDMTMILYLGGMLSAIILIAGVVISLTSDKTLVDERLGKYVEDETSTINEAAARTQVVSEWIDQKVTKSTWGGNLRQELARADLRLRPGEYIGLMIFSTVALGVFGWFIGGQSIVFGLAGGILGIFLPRIYVRREQNRRLVKFNDQLGDMLNLMVNGLRAGYSTMQAMEAVSKELPSPICDEFRRVVQEMQLGISMEAALENLIRRIPSDDLDLVITAINVQREVGGNLAEILDTISYTIRERVRIKGEIRVLVSQVMYSGRFLSLMPLIVFGIIWLLNRDYMMTFFKPETGLCGIIALVLAGILIVSGYFAMTKLADIEV
jgi:tight adherence protein B